MPMLSSIFFVFPITSLTSSLILEISLSKSFILKVAVFALSAEMPRWLVRDLTWTSIPLSFSKFSSGVHKSNSPFLCSIKWAIFSSCSLETTFGKADFEPTTNNFDILSGLSILFFQIHELAVYAINSLFDVFGCLAFYFRCHFFCFLHFLSLIFFQALFEIFKLFPVPLLQGSF